MSIWRQLTRFFRKRPAAAVEKAGSSVQMLEAGYQGGDQGRFNRSWMDQFRENDSLRAPEHRVAEDSAMVPWSLYRVNRDGTRRKVENELSTWWEMPSPGELGLYFRYSSLVQLDMAGNSFWHFMDPTDITAGAVLLRVQDLISLPTRKKPYYEFRVNGVTENFNPREIVWLKRPDPGNPMGLGSGFGDALGPNLQQLEHMNRFNNQFFRQGAHLGTVMGVEGLSDDGWDRLEELWKQDREGIANAFKSFFVSGKVTGLQLAAKHRDLDFVEGYEQKRASVRQTVGTPAEIIGDNKNSNKATSYEAGNLHQTYGIFPRLQHLKLVLNLIVLPKFGYSQFQFDFENPIREKDELQADKFEAGMVRGAVTINEYRRYLDLDPIQGGDHLMVPLNTAPTMSTELDQLRAQVLNRSGSRNPSDPPNTGANKSILDKFYSEAVNGHHR